MKKLAAFFVVAATLPAQQPAAEPPPLGVVSGVVIDVTTQMPIAKVVVNLQLEDLPSDDSLQGRTSDEGKFTIENVKPGRYYLYSKRNQYVASDGAGSLRGNAVLDVGPGQVIDDLVLGLRPAAVIAGRVVDEDGDPVEGLTVQAVKALYIDGAPQLLGTYASQTNDKGEYRLYGLPPGSYYVRASPGQLNSVIGAGTPADGVLTYVDTYYPNAYDASQAIPLRPTGSAEIQGIDVRMTRIRTLRISGHVVDGQTGQPGLTGFLALLNRDQSGEQPSLRRMNVRAQDGGFEGDGLRPGRYRLEASVSLSGTTRGYAVYDFDLSDRSIENMQLRTLPSFGVSGRVVLESDEDGGELPKPMQISLELPGAHSLLNPTALVGDDNQFLVKSVVAESYRVGAYGLGDLYLKSARYGGREASAEPVRIEPEGGELEIVLSANAARLDGQITRDAEGVPGAYVVLIPEDRTRKDLYQSVSTDQYGVYAITGIAPGRYKVFAWEKIESSGWLDPNVLAAAENQGIRVELEERDAKRITPELIEAKD